MNCICSALIRHSFRVCACGVDAFCLGLPGLAAFSNLLSDASSRLALLMVCFVKNAQNTSQNKMSK